MKKIVVFTMAIVLIGWNIGSIRAGVLGDADNDGKVGLPEAVSALQAAAGLRSDLHVTDVIVWKDSWKADVAYKKSDAVEYEGTSYVCIEDHESKEEENKPPSETQWKVLTRSDISGDATFENLDVTNRIKVGTNSLYLGNNPLDPSTPSNELWTTNGDLYIQDGQNGINYNTIFSANGSTGKVGIGTVNPDSKLHIEEAISVSEQQVVHVNFSNAAASVSGAKGITVESVELTDMKGSQIAVHTETSMNHDYEGSATVLLSYVSGWNAKGRIVGVNGDCKVNRLSNPSESAGGRFYVGPEDGTTLNLGTGNHWISGVYGEVRGLIDGDPGTGTVAGVVGVDNSTGNANSWAGHFKGRLLVKGSTVNDLSDFVNEQPDVDSGSSVIWAAYGHGSSQTNNPMLFQATGSDGGDKFVVRNNGNVGIGTMNPAANLHVNDTALFSGVVTIEDGQHLRAQTNGGARILGGQGGTAENPAIGFFSTNGVDDGGGGNGIFRPLANQMAFATASTERMRITHSGNVGINTTDPQCRLDVNGDICYSGSLVSGSDRRWKTDIRPLEDSLEKVSELQGVNYEWKKEEYPEKSFSEGRQIGLIAQEVEPVFPEIVRTDDDGYKSVSYQKLVPVLVEAVKELKAQNEALKARIKALENK